MFQKLFLEKQESSLKFMEVPTEKRYEKYIEKALTEVVDDDLKYRSKIHKFDSL